MTRVVFFMLDGVRPDALVEANCPNINRLIQRGSVTMRASSVMPCITLPCHTSIFHSVLPARHGITSNEWRPMARPVAGLVDLLGAAQKTAAVFYNWEPLRDLSRPGSLEFSCFHNGQHARDGDDITSAEVVRYLSRQQPDFTFVYFGTVDAVGHDFGWMSPEYLAQLERVDAALGRVVDALPDDCAFVVQADHGGHDRDHGENIPEDMTIPWLATGPGIQRGYEIQSSVSLIDTAPTIARLLGLAHPADWEGRCIEEIFQDSLPA